MDSLIYGIIAGLVFVLLIVFLVIALKKKQMREPDYKGLFWLGIFFLVMYLVSIFFFKYQTNVVFLTLGIVYLVMGLANKGKWGRPRQLITDERVIKTKVYLILGLVVVLVLGVVVFLIIGK